jgi:pimeloyl-ACP methyl ester carboxylesterase
VRGEHGVVGDDATRFVSALPAGQLVTVPAAGHNVHSDNPEALTTAIEQFLDDIARTDADWVTNPRP